MGNKRSSKLMWRGETGHSVCSLPSVSLKEMETVKEAGMGTRGDVVIVT
jgi:hypothetical protein